MLFFFLITLWADSQGHVHYPNHIKAWRVTTWKNKLLRNIAKTSEALPVTLPSDMSGSTEEPPVPQVSVLARTKGSFLMVHMVLQAEQKKNTVIKTNAIKII